MTVFVVALGVAALTGCNEKARRVPVQPVGHVNGGPIDFGEVPVNDIREAVIEIDNPVRVQFALRSLQLSNNPSFKMIRRHEVVPPGSTRRVVIRFQPLEEGERVDQVNIDTDGATTERLLEVRGTGVPAPIALDPPVLDFETLEIDSERVLEVTVTNPVALPVQPSMAGDGAAHFQPLVTRAAAYSSVRVPPSWRAGPAARWSRSATAATPRSSSGSRGRPRVRRRSSRARGRSTARAT